VVLGCRRFVSGTNTSIKAMLPDVLASLVVMLVAVPLCLGVATAVGLPATMGLLSGIIGGLVVSPLGGSRLLITGPPAGLITIVWGVLHTHGIEHFGVIVLCAGLFQIVFSFFPVGLLLQRLSPAIPPAMLGGIGLLIMANQLHVMADVAPQSAWLDNLLGLPKSLMLVLQGIPNSSHVTAAFVGLLTLGVLMLYRFLPLRWKVLPAPLLAISLAATISAVCQFEILYVTIPENVWASLNWISPDDWGYFLTQGAVISAITVALVASIESVLTAASIDNTELGETTDFKRELRAQGIGNTLIGLFGGMPVTGVIVQSAANVQANAQTRLSGLLHGVWLLLFLLIFPSVLTFVPLSALAALLVYIGGALVCNEHVKELWKLDKFEFMIYAVTILGVVMTSLLEGILIGITLSVFRYVYCYCRATLKSAH
jgi:MFS superfamily sulfate permease-like transporter